MSTPLPTRVRLDLLRLDGGTQARAGINEAVVAEYATAMLSGAAFPPVIAFFDGESYWVADGHHRVLAARITGLVELATEVRAGTREHAAWFGCSANQNHGLRRSSADKRNAIVAALRLRPSESDRAIAEHVGVDHKTVAVCRRALVAGGEIPQPTARTGVDGKKYTPTANARPAPPSPPPPALVLALFEPAPRQLRSRRLPTLRRVLGAALVLSKEEQRALLHQLRSQLADCPKVSRPGVTRRG